MVPVLSLLIRYIIEEYSMSSPVNVIRITVCEMVTLVGCCTNALGADHR
jgi:hypothetical protein